MLNVPKNEMHHLKFNLKVGEVSLGGCFMSCSPGNGTPCKLMYTFVIVDLNIEFYFKVDVTFHLESVMYL